MVILTRVVCVCVILPTIRFGGYLVSRELAEVGDIITVFFSILIGAFYFGQSGPNFQKIAEAEGGAASIYTIIDRAST
jgi:ATP-binding cassette subfamily B (MDR/TAP) protein 1